MRRLITTTIAFAFIFSFIFSSLAFAEERTEFAECQFFAKGKEKNTEFSPPFFVPVKEHFTGKLDEEQWLVMWPKAKRFFEDKKIEDYSEVGLFCTNMNLDSFYLVSISLHQQDE